MNKLELAVLDRSVPGLAQYAAAHKLPYWFNPNSTEWRDFGQYETLYKFASVKLNPQIEIWLGVGELTATPMLVVDINLQCRSPHFILECRREDQPPTDQVYGGAEHISLEGNFGADYDLYASLTDRIAALQVLTPDVMAAVMVCHPERMELADGRITLAGIALGHAVSAAELQKLIDVCANITKEIAQQLTTMSTAKFGKTAEYQALHGFTAEYLTKRRAARKMTVLLGVPMGYLCVVGDYLQHKGGIGMMLYGFLFIMLLTAIVAYPVGKGMPEPYYPHKGVLKRNLSTKMMFFVSFIAIIIVKTISMAMTASAGDISIGVLFVWTMFGAIANFTLFPMMIVSFIRWRAAASVDSVVSKRWYTH